MDNRSETCGNNHPMLSFSNRMSDKSISILIRQTCLFCLAQIKDAMPQNVNFLRTLHIDRHVCWFLDFVDFARDLDCMIRILRTMMTTLNRFTKRHLIQKMYNQYQMIWIYFNNRTIKKFVLEFCNWKKNSSLRTMKNRINKWKVTTFRHQMQRNWNYPFMFTVIAFVISIDKSSFFIQSI